MTQALTINHRALGVADQYGNPGIVTTSTSTTKGWLTQIAASELTENRDTALSDWELSLPKDQLLDANDQIVDDIGRTFEVVGTPNVARTPQRISHIVVRCRYISG